ncbi:MAG TPA: glycosyltransferase [Blastocatellia bacterium]|nr:glycosyltransferase [Blastocatellia bacterium]
MKRAALYICYYNVTEPLVQTQVVAYLGELAKRGIEMHLLTFERERHPVEKQHAIRDELSKRGIQWHWLVYHQRPSLPATVYDIVIGTAAALRICVKHQIRLVHARSHVPAAMALVTKGLLGCRFLFDIRGLLAEEYVDAGNWTRDDVKFQLTKRMERLFFKRADGFVLLTDRIKQELTLNEPLLEHRASDIQVIPCCTETNHFSGDWDTRSNYRKARGWTDRVVITYVGKLGTWYLLDEMARFFAAAKRHDPRFFFQILTQSEEQAMRRALDVAGVNPSDYDIRFASAEDLPRILSGSDAGLSFIRASYSKLASSPTKVGEYLAAGLPVITNAGIGDCDQMMNGNRVGIVISEFSEREFIRAASNLSDLLKDKSTAARCRALAETELSLSKVGGPRYAAIYENLLGAASL